MAKTASLLIGAVSLLIAACAVNEQGLVKVRYFENGSSYLISHESWGGYLSTRQADGGLTLGHSERILIYPKQDKPLGLSVNEWMQQAGNRIFSKEISAEDVRLKNKQPYAWIEKNQGMIVHANAIKTGFTLGIETRSAIRLPADFDGIFIFGYRDDGTIEAVIDETLKTE
ncbi:MAG: hypothetical protein ACU83N_10960 [Gammaproteobacteria bacterium]